MDEEARVRPEDRIQNEISAVKAQGLEDHCTGLKKSSPNPTPRLAGVTR